MPFVVGGAGNANFGITQVAAPAKTAPSQGTVSANGAVSEIVDLKVGPTGVLNQAQAPRPVDTSPAAGPPAAGTTSKGSVVV